MNNTQNNSNQVPQPAKSMPVITAPCKQCGYEYIKWQMKDGMCHNCNW